MPNRDHHDDEEIRACTMVPLGLHFAEDGQFGAKSSKNTNRLARLVCNGCSVKDSCLELAMTNHEQHGMWGGLGPRERRALRLAREVANQSAEENENARSQASHVMHQVVLSQ